MPAIRNNPGKWSRNAQNAQQDYQSGVQNPRVQWDTATAAAAGNYEAGVTRAIANKSFAKGVKATGHDGWQQATLAKGPTRFAEGVRAGQAAYDQGFAPYAQVIQNTNLPARGPKGSTQNYQRAQAMGQALNAAKVKFQGGTVS
jgi:hypothetical protein